MRHFTDTALEPALWWVGEWSLRWAALIALLAVGLAVWRPRRAVTRHLLCLAVLLAGLLLPAMPRWGPGLPAPAPEPEEAPAPPVLIERPPPLPPAPPAVATAPAVEEEVPRSAPLAAAEPWGARRLTVIGLAALWALGALLLLARWAGGIAWLWRLRRTAVAAPEAAGLFAACRAETGLSHRVGLASHPAVRSPVALGFLRPLVLVPPVWAELPEAAQRAGLLHELAHLRRQDHRLVPLLELLRAVLFFHLPLHWLLGRLERERELLCDEAAVAHGVAPRQLAGTLLHFASCPSRLLPAFGRRRTVRARIRHLLEDDMERSTSPLPFRRAVAVGLLVVGLALGFASLRLWAAPEAPPEQAPSVEGPAAEGAGDAPGPAQRFPKEALRYGGKSFERWRTELLTELKPAVRADGMRALATFGVNGYGAEATRAILELMRGYDKNNLDGDDRGVFNAAYEAVRKIGDPSVPALREGLKEKNRNVRRFAALVLSGNSTWAATAVPELLAALRDSDPYVRCDAVNALGSVRPRPKAYLPALLQSIKDEDTRVRNATMDNLRKIGRPAREAVPALLDVLANGVPSLRITAIQALRAIKPEAKAVLPALIRAVQDPNRGVGPDATNFYGAEVEEGAVQALGELGPAAAEAVPVLIEVLKRQLPSMNSRVHSTIRALGQIGPAAREAAPLIRVAGRRWRGHDIEQDAEAALRNIEK